MPAMLNRLNIARALTIVGFLIGLRSVGFTWAHIGDVAAMVVVLLILYAPKPLRQPAVWWSMLILLFGFYAPFWVGVPFMAELAAPSMSAEIQHIMMALPPLVGLFLCRSYYFPSDR